MKSSRFFIFCFLSLFGSITRAQTPDSALAYFPLSSGNKWQYASYIDKVSPGFLWGYFTITVTGDSMFPNGNEYRMLRQDPFTYYTTPFHPYPTGLRMDSTTAVVYEASPQVAGGELIWDSIRAGQGYGYPWGNLTIRRDTILDVPTVSRTVSTSPSTAFTLAYNLGPVFFSAIDGEDLTRLSVLVYARIDGHEFGTSVSVNKTVQSTPTGYELFPNFPNPFNPSTTIRYALPQRSHVTLIVYNTLGQQVAGLVDGIQEAGYHTAEFNGSGLASGVYFYRLQAGEFGKCRRLVLLK